MRSTTILVIAATALAGLSGTAAAQEAMSDTFAVRATLHQFHEALAQGDSAAVLSLLADDAVILEAGGAETRAEYRAHHLPADIRFAASVPSKAGPMQVTLAGDVAWVTSTSEATGAFDGRPINSAGAELAVLTRSSAGWQIRAIHWSSRRRGP